MCAVVCSCVVMMLVTFGVWCSLLMLSSVCVVGVVCGCCGVVVRGVVVFGCVSVFGWAALCLICFVSCCCVVCDRSVDCVCVCLFGVVRQCCCMCDVGLWFVGFVCCLSGV